MPLPCSVAFMTIIGISAFRSSLASSAPHFLASSCCLLRWSCCCAGPEQQIFGCVIWAAGLGGALTCLHSALVCLVLWICSCLLPTLLDIVTRCATSKPRCASAVRPVLCRAPGAVPQPNFLQIHEELPVAIASSSRDSTCTCRPSEVLES